MAITLLQAVSNVEMLPPMGQKKMLRKFPKCAKKSLGLHGKL